MKKWMIPVLLSAICAMVAPLWETHTVTQRQVIYLHGGETVLADTVTKSDQFVFYVADGNNGMFMKNDVKSIGAVQVERNVSVLKTIEGYRDRASYAAGPAAAWLRGVDGRWLVFFVLLPVFFGLLGLACLLIRLSQKAQTAPSPVPDSAGDQKKPPRAATPESHALSDVRDIAMFFTELYRIQNGFPENTPTRFSMTPDSAKRKMKVFEISLKGSSDWLTRRMSIGPLGEDTGSKSKCYYVIYDTHMVVKIPPTPVTDMEKYTSAIRREINIAAQLAPVACIVPMVSVILKKIKKLPFADSLSQEQLETQYIRLVEAQPDYQEHLTIGGRFAFFMELSNSFFLGRVIDELHEAKENIADEINASPDIAWNQAVFTTRYGLEALPVFDGLQRLYLACAAEARRIVQETESGTIQDYQLKNWFLAAIAGETVWDDHKGLDAALIERLRSAFSAVLRSNQADVDAMVQLLRRELAAKTFSQRKNQIENIASNMLVLLCQLKKRQVALRDLKPDNLFMDAAPDEYPVFLNDKRNFSIGVIDVETAISLERTPDGTVNQPLLGGTPLYATPLHVLKNETIGAFFGDPVAYLHLQDWYATIAIIFKTITGSNLFPRAARSFPAILKILKSGRSKNDPDEATVKAMSQKFWTAAATDMKHRLSAAKATLRQLALDVPDDMVPAITEELERQVKHQLSAIHSRVGGSPLLRRESNRRFLLDASSREIQRQQERWRSASDLPAAHRDMAPEMVSFLKKLHHLKVNVEEKQHAIADLSSAPGTLHAHLLMEAMFQIVFRWMYRPEWRRISAPQTEPPEKSPAAGPDRLDEITAIPDEC